MKIEIPSWRVNHVRASLEACGIEETTIFPDLEGLGRAVTLSWKRETTVPPHTEVYTRIGRSKIDKAGVGVFAIKGIKKGSSLFGADDGGVQWIAKSEIAKIHGEARRLYDDFAVIKDGRYGCPPTFNQLTPSWYLNKSKTPNVFCGRDYKFFALKDIKKGEELTVDYANYSEEPY